jgi:hypothetical protein
MLNFLKKNAALSGQKTCSKSRRIQKNAEKDQENLLLSLTDTAKKLFGREHDFENIKSVKDFQERVPVSDYEDLKPYIERVKKGQANILWTDTPEYFAKTSGTTSGSKYIPISKEGMPFRLKELKVLFFIISLKKQC